MTCPQMEVDIFQYAVGTSWKFDGRIKLRFIEANHAHPAAVMIVGELGKEFARVPLEQFYQAVKWMHDGAPR